MLRVFDPEALRRHLGLAPGALALLYGAQSHDQRLNPLGGWGVKKTYDAIVHLGLGGIPSWWEAIKEVEQVGIHATLSRQVPWGCCTAPKVHQQLPGSLTVC